MSEGIKRGQVVGSTVREALAAIIDDIGDHQVLALALISMGQPDCAQAVVTVNPAQTPYSAIQAVDYATSKLQNALKVALVQRGNYED